MEKTSLFRLVFLFIGVFLPFTLSLLIEGPTKEELIPKNRRILEHKKSKKCLTVQVEDFKLYLDDCNWDKGRTDLDGVYSVIKSNPGGHLLRWNTGPKPQGIEGCLTIKGDQRRRDEADDVFLAECDPKSTVQNWIFEPLADEERKGEYIVKKFNEDKCLVITPASDSSDSDTTNYTGGTPQVVSCNTEDSEQIWRICENLPDIHKCDL